MDWELANSVNYLEINTLQEKPKQSCYMYFIKLYILCKMYGSSMDDLDNVLLNTI